MKRTFLRPLTLLLVLASPAALAERTNAVTALSSELPDMGLSLVRALGALAVVLALFFAGVWLFRNSQRLAWRKHGAPKLAILESRPLGNRYTLHVVSYEQQRLLVGSSPAGLTLISQLPTASGFELPVAQSLPADRVPFAQQLQQLLKREPVPAPKTGGARP